MSIWAIAVIWLNTIQSKHAKVPIHWLNLNICWKEYVMADWRICLLSLSNFSMSNCKLSPFQNKPWFLRVCSTGLLKTLQEKEKLLVTSNFSFSCSVFYPFREFFATFIKFEIAVCKLFQFWRVQNLSFGKGLNLNICWKEYVMERWRICLVSFSNFSMSICKLKVPVIKIHQPHILQIIYWSHKSLTLYHTIPTFNNSEKETFWKHCGKRRKCW